MCIRDRVMLVKRLREVRALHSFTRVIPPMVGDPPERRAQIFQASPGWLPAIEAVSYTHLRAHETVLDLVCRLLLEKKKHIKKKKRQKKNDHMNTNEVHAQ